MNKKFRLGLVLSSLVLAGVIALSTAGTLPSQVAGAEGPEGANAVVAWDTDGNNGNKKSFLGTTNNKPFVLKTNNAERVRVTQDGKVGVGTTKPVTSLHVGGVDSRLRLESTGADLWTVTEYKADGREWHTGVGGSQVTNQLQNKFYLYDVNAATSRMVIDTNGNVGFGTNNPAAAMDVTGGSLRLSHPGGFGDIEFTESADMLAFKTTETTNPDGEALRVGTGSGGTRVFTVRNDGVAQLGALADPTTKHVCINNDLMLAHCSSSAEYVPTIDSGKGYPQTADLVSIASDIQNPYGDKHGPFAVEKSTTACDDNLLGFIIDPKLGANGITLNNHYLPLAIYGYFPAKVTIANGPIKRGDPITSSSRAGYGMKATDACKVIGYALEDANADGTIQVFANFGDNAAARVRELQQENDALKQLLLKFESRVAALESAAPAAQTLTFMAR